MAGVISEEGMMLHEKHREWVEARGLGSMIELFGIETRSRPLERNGRWIDANWIVLPYLLDGKPVNHKWRLASEKEHKMDDKAPLVLFNADDLKGATEVVITEGEWDTLAYKVAMGMEAPCVSVPNGADEKTAEERGKDVWTAQRYEWFDRHQNDLANVKTFILAADGDKAGRALAADLAVLLNPERCKFVEYPEGTKDLNEVLLTYGREAVEKCVAEAKPYPVKNLYRLKDFPLPADLEMIDAGLPGMEEMFGLVVGTLTVITGWAGQGKSTLLMAMLGHLLRKGIAMVVGSFETEPVPIMQVKLRGAYYGCAEHSQRVWQTGEADEAMDRLLSVIVNGIKDDEDDLTVEAVLELARIAVLRDGARLLVIDPWNELEHKRERDETETDYAGRALRAIKRFARLYMCAVWLVAHPRKPQTDGTPRPPSLYDLAGSANFANKADYGVVVHRPDVTTPQVRVRVSKVRMGLPGKCGERLLAWNPMTSSYDVEEWQ